MNGALRKSCLICSSLFLSVDQWNRWNIYLYSKKDLENIYAEKNESFDFVKALPARQPYCNGV